MTDDVVITPQENGPYYVRGTFKIVLSDGTKLEAQGETWLCRCGDSGTKPFCDGTHSTAGFHCDNAEMTPTSG
ncbi:MAG TPA: CDGSH iron-sulfur domain-containing protein [Gemmatimonadota bacterium]|nr:CDGSH iron-sulfur domain-containing protein [Gemmatimonadota bacterium]